MMKKTNYQEKRSQTKSSGNTSLLNSGAPSGSGTFREGACCLCEFICVSVLLFLEGLVSFGLRIFLPPLLTSSLNPEEKGSMETSHLRLSVPRCLTLHLVTFTTERSLYDDD